MTPDNSADANATTGAVYEQIADNYAAAVDSSPYNAYYERPAMLALLPPVAGRRVLDAGCGTGWYTEYLVQQGALVTAVDRTARFVQLTRARIGDAATVQQADLSQPLSFAPDTSFDLVLCPLVLHYIENWAAVFAEFHRVLAPGGRLLFSTHHPFGDWQLFQTASYFATEEVEDEWDVGKVRFYRRPLCAMTEALAGAGFVIERLVEPQPTEEFRRVHPAGYERLMKNPGFLVIMAWRAEAASTGSQR